MKFYSVKDKDEDYTAVIWAKNVAEAVAVFRRDIVDAKSTITMETEIDELYNLMTKANEKSMITQLSVDEVMRRLEATISSTVPVVVLTRGVD